MSNNSDLRASLIERGFIIPCGDSPEQSDRGGFGVSPLNQLQRDHLRKQAAQRLGDPDLADDCLLVDEPIHDTYLDPKSGEWKDYRLPPLTNQWRNDWARRVAAGQPTVHLKAPRWAYYGGA